MNIKSPSISLLMGTPRAEKRVLGGRVHFLARGLRTDVPLFPHIEEKGARRVVRKDSELHAALIDALKDSSAPFIGGEEFVVTSVKNETECTIEYKTHYSS